MSVGTKQSLSMLKQGEKQHPWPHFVRVQVCSKAYQSQYFYTVLKEDTNMQYKMYFTVSILSI